MRPELRIVDVRQYRAGDQANDYGKLAVAVENIGTAPTLGKPGILILDYPTEASEAIIPPAQRQSYVGMVPPLLFINQNQQNCGSEADFEILVETAIGKTLRQAIHAVIGGEVVSTGLTGQYTCTDISIEMNDEPINE